MGNIFSRIKKSILKKKVISKKKLYRISLQWILIYLQRVSVVQNTVISISFQRWGSEDASMR
jgi:hypothetical protein